MYSRCASLSQRKTEWIFDFWVLILDFRSERGSVSRSASEHQAAFGQLDCARPTAPAAGQRPALRSSGGPFRVHARHPRPTLFLTYEYSRDPSPNADRSRYLPARGNQWFVEPGHWGDACLADATGRWTASYQLARVSRSRGRCATGQDRSGLGEAA